MKNLTAEIAALMNWMIVTYHINSAADEYWFGFTVDGKTYVVPNLPWETLVTFFKPDFTSHKKGHKFIIRIKATADQCRDLIPSALYIGPEGVLTEKVKNAGDGLEMVLTERFTAEEWVKHDSTPFNKGGDLRINGKEVQVKLNSATLTSADYLRKVCA